MSEGTHRCAVEGCPNLAAYEVIHYSLDLAEGAVVFAQDETCPYICVEHAIDNERGSQGDKAPDAVSTTRTRIARTCRGSASTGSSSPPTSRSDVVRAPARR